MQIGEYIVGQEPIIIGECGLNHQGSIDRALLMIGECKRAGCNVVKFQTFKASEFCSPDDPLYPEFVRSELPESAWPIIAEECERQGVMFLTTPQNHSDLLMTIPYLKAIKVGSDDGTNYELLAQYRAHNLPMIVSLGMATFDQMGGTIGLLRDNAVYMICTSQYPCPDEEARVSRVSTLSKMVDYVGFSDHTKGNEAAIMAVAYGASVFEKHFTLNHDFEGPDHKWACEPGELKSWCDSIKRAWGLRGDSSLNLTTVEEEQRLKYQRRSGNRVRGWQ